MKLPAGRQAGAVIDPRKDDVVQSLKAFKGVIEIDTSRGRGFILMRDGELVAAYFEGEDGIYRGNSAVSYVMNSPASNGGQNQQNFVLKTYNQEDYKEALTMCTLGGLFISTAPQVQDDLSLTTRGHETSGHTSPLVDESILNKIMSQPGVVAVSAFYEGFPVLSLGEADFEHVAARAEDFLRAGTRISEDMNLGQPGQLILETEENKFIIVPCGDLFLCIITRADAQLGLIRVLIRSIQNEVESEA